MSLMEIELEELKDKISSLERENNTLRYFIKSKGFDLVNEDIDLPQSKLDEIYAEYERINKTNYAYLF